MNHSRGTPYSRPLKQLERRESFLKCWGVAGFFQNHLNSGSGTGGSIEKGRFREVATGGLGPNEKGVVVEDLCQGGKKKNALKPIQRSQTKNYKSIRTEQTGRINK